MSSLSTRSAVPRATRVLLTIAAIATTLLAAIADSNQTHLFNPEWTDHSRFHAALWILTNLMAGLGALYLIYGRYAERDSRLAIRMAAFLVIMIWAPFFPSLLAPNTSAWPDGVTRVFAISPQVIFAGVLVLMSLVAVRIDARARSHGGT